MMTKTTTMMMMEILFILEEWDTFSPSYVISSYGNKTRAIFKKSKNTKYFFFKARRILASRELKVQ
jgi:fructoselysine-6-P-deglycase FrlB-like protein